MDIKFSRTCGKYGCFSNFYLCNVEFDGLQYSNSEAAWQSHKTLNESERKDFCSLSPSDSKKKGKRVHLRSDWEDIKYQLMIAVCYEKFSQNKELGDILKSTGDAVLIENTTGWHDNIWGNCECPRCSNKVGQNLLGKALMEVRSMLNN